MFAAGHGAGAFGVNLVTQVVGEGLTDVGSDWLGWEGDGWNTIGVSVNETLFALVPGRKKLGGGGGADESLGVAATISHACGTLDDDRSHRVRNSSESHTWNVTRRSVYALKVPYSLCRFRLK